MTEGPRAREQSAAGLEAILSPRSVAVVGASPDAASVGHRLLANILRAGFTGPVFPIHPRAPEVLGVPAHRSVLDVAQPIDLAVVAVPAPAVRGVLEECARKGVRGIVLVTAGFREAGPDGARLEQELGALVRAHGMRLVGPNCLGVVNADPKVRLHAIFADARADGGPVALMTQSGALGIALLDRAHRMGLGIGRFVSMGNKLDVSGNDLLLHWAADPAVHVVAMHLESIGNPRNFMRIAREVGAAKPILLVKGGRTPEGARAAGSHTGAMVEADQLVDALVAQAGVVRVPTVEALFDAALALSLQPLPRGGRVAIVTNSGGPAILLADALPPAGLTLAVPAASTLQSCAARLPAGAAVSNPLDMLAGASPATLQACLADLLRDPAIDIVVALATPLADDDTPWAQAILAAAREVPGKTLAAVLFGRDGASQGFARLVQGGVPTFTFPENAAQALGAMARVARTRRDRSPQARGEGVGAAATVTPPAAPVPGPRGRPATPGWVSPEAALTAVAAAGLPHPAMERAADPEGAAQAATRLGFPVALKVEAQGLVHKTEAGAVRLGLADREAVLREAHVAWEQVRGAGHAPRGFLVQRMAPPGVEMIVGAVRDPRFGPIVSVGLGGIYTEALRDIAVRLAPVTPAEAAEMVASLRSRPLLQGVRGEPPKDEPALREAVAAVSRLIADDPTIQEVEVNPLRVLAQGKGVVAVDARLRVEPAA